jgi:hypothetical protein
MLLLRWDLDRTYLDTDIHSVSGLVRAAVETASQKRAIPGAPALVQALLARPRPTTFSVLSGSPTQLREVLMARLALDGLRPESLILKDNLRNLRRGRLAALRGQLGHKLPHLLADRLTWPASTRELLFGDDAEVDVLVYGLYAGLVEGTVSAEEADAVLGEAGAYADQRADLRRSLRRLHPAPAVEGIFIRLDVGHPTASLEAADGRAMAVHAWSQAAMRLVETGHLDPEDAQRVFEAEGSTPRDVAGLLQDAVRRGWVGHPTASRFLQIAPSTWSLAADPALARLPTAPPDRPPAVADWIAQLRALRTETTAAGRREARREPIAIRSERSPSKADRSPAVAQDGPTATASDSAGLEP